MKKAIITGAADQDQAEFLLGKNKKFIVDYKLRNYLMWREYMAMETKQ